MAVGTIPVPRTEIAHIGLLSKSIGRQYEQALFFTQFTSDVIRDKMGELKTPLSPIVRLNEFAKDGMDNLLIPVMRNLKGAPFYGDRWMSGKGEKQKWDFTKVLINSVGFPVEGPGIMSNQRVKGLQLISRIRGQLAVRMAIEDEIQATFAFHEGFSRNITAAVADAGYAITKRYHPNILVAGDGKVTWSGTPQTHANNIGTALDTLTDVTGDHFSVANLEKMRAYVQTIPLEPIMVKGKPYYLMLVHSNSIAQLRTDPNYKEINSQGHLRGLENPMFATAEIFQSNFLIYERIFSALGYDQGTPSGGNYTLTVGATEPIVALDSAPRKAAVVFGNGALAKGLSGGILIGKQEQNIQGFEEHAIRQLLGYARTTAYDVDISGASNPTAQLDQGSALFFTYSPDVS